VQLPKRLVKGCGPLGTRAVSVDYCEGPFTFRLKTIFV